MSNPIPNLNAVNSRLREIGRDLAPDMVSKLHRKIMFDVLGGVVKRTPVDSGRARGGWQVSIGTPAVTQTQPEVGNVGDAAGRTVTVGSAKISGIKPFTVSYINNNVSYIGVLDQGGYLPRNPADDGDARRLRAARRDEIHRKRAQAALGDPGATFVKGGYSFQAPAGMLALTLADVLRELQ